MQEVSELYRRLFERDHGVEYQVRIAGEVYDQDSLVSVRIYGGLYEGPDIGCAQARQVELSLFPRGTIPRQAKIEAFVRLTDGSEASEWIPQGVFFFSTREMDQTTGVLNVQGFDAMLKAEGSWIVPEPQVWPKPVGEVVARIAAAIGVEIDPRTELDAAFPVREPEGGADEYGVTALSMREELSCIAIENAGNWIITPEGKLLLVPLDSAPALRGYLVDEFGNIVTVGGRRILL